MSRLVALLVLLACGQAAADSFWRPPPTASRARRMAAAQGDLHLTTARLQTTARGQQTIVRPDALIFAEARKAISAYERALLAPGPDDAELHYRAMIAAEYIDVRGAANCIGCRDGYEAVVRHAEGFRKADPRDPRLENVVFRACVARSKLGGLGGRDADEQLRRAIAEYALYRTLIDEGQAYYGLLMAQAASNEAELHMGLGDLDEAIRLYQLSADLNPAEALAYYGLAVAYDRDGQWTKAIAAMETALRLDRDLDRLSDALVFFVPDGDVFYYRALGYHTLYVRTREPRFQSLAAELYDKFLARERTGRYHERAREHRRELEKGPRPIRPRPELLDFGEEPW